MLFQHLVLQTARRLPQKVALIDGARRLSYGEWVAAAERLAGLLRARGVRRGDRVLLFLPNAAELCVALLAVLEAGAVVVPVHPQTKAGKLAYLLRDTEAVAMIAHGSLSGTWQPALGEAGNTLAALVITGALAGHSADLGSLAPIPFDAAMAEPGAPAALAPPSGNIDLDLAAIIYTSGTTGQPKGVMLSHRNMVSAARSVLAYLPLGADDVIACVLPMCFSYGLYQPFLAGAVGATVLIEAGFTFPVRVLENMARERATVFPGVPAVYATLLGMPAATLERFDLGSLRLMTNAAAALPVTQLAELRRRFPGVRFYSMYGQTECKRISYLDPDELDRRPGSVGRGMPNQELFLATAEGQLRPAHSPGITGELVVRGSHVMVGYWRKPGETAAKLREAPAGAPAPLTPGERLLYTGDVFASDAGGFLHFVARQDDIIKSRGEKVSPREVEDVLHELPGVSLAAVIGIPDPLLGEAVKAFIVPAEGARLEAREVIKFCLSRLENYMVPKHVVFVDALPMTSSGKVNKSELKEKPQSP
jgi:acyl-CoA synthetase (AMP-forming)/AMP-acid ligase II